jgi:hypothetical protein
MASRVETMQKELAELVRSGDLLYYSLADDLKKLPEKFKKQLREKNIELPRFDSAYETWYSEAQRVVKQILPDRLDDFVKHYKNEKRKEIDFLTYTISDALLGLTTRKYGDVVADKGAALPKMEGQVNILKSAQKKFASALFDITEVLQADLFDSELGAAQSLANSGFVRAAGAVAGVVLEKHLAHACEQHNLKSKKAHPAISEFYQLLKEAGVIDTPMWRFIQHLADVRNLCDHGKDREPTKQEVLEMIEGVKKVVKSVF